MSGDVECFRGAHLPLAIFAILVLLVCFLAIPFTAVIATVKVYVSIARSSIPLAIGLVYEYYAA